MSVIIGLVIFFAVVLVGVYAYNKMRSIDDANVNEAFADASAPVLPKADNTTLPSTEIKSEAAKIRENNVNEVVKAPAKKAKKPAAKKASQSKGPKKPKLEVAK